MFEKKIEQSIPSRYMQLIIKSYHFFSDKFSLNELEKPSKIHNFPVLLGNNKQSFSSLDFHTERFFSNLYKNQTKPKSELELELKSKSKPKLSRKVIKTTNENKVIKISNIPVNNGHLSSRFGFRKDPMHGSRRLHKGIDIAARYGSPVNPLGEGLVVFSGYKSGFGNTVEIKHGNSVLTRYAHLKQYLVDKGQKVKVGDKIGLIGSTGRSTGPHLHLEVLLNGIQVDPQIFLANHFGSRKKPLQISANSKKRLNKNKKVFRKIAGNKFPKVNNFPQVSYHDYVKSVNGLFGLSAPTSFNR